MVVLLFTHNLPLPYCAVTSAQEPTEPWNTGLWLADNQSRDLNDQLWLAVYLIRSVPVSALDNLVDCAATGSRLKTEWNFMIVGTW